MENKLLGEKIKSERLSQSMKIKDLAKQIGVSSSLLSQIERGLASPSLSTLRSITEALNIPMFSLFLQEKEKIGKVELVRKNERIRVTDGHTEEKNIELSYDLLSPDLKGDIQLCEMKLSSGEINSKTLHAHDAEEVAVCVEGEITLILQDEEIILKNGDSVRIEKNTGHRWENNYNSDSKIIFAISPPIF